MQYILKFPHVKKYYAEDFIVSESNQNSYDYISAWPNNWGVDPYPNALLLYGPQYSGKTHLCHIWAEKSSAHFIKPNEYELPNFESLMPYNALIIENLDEYQIQQDLLLHLFNFAFETKKFLLLTSGTKAQNLTYDLADLRSRINSVMQISISFPDLEMIRIILHKNFSEKSLKVSTDVINYLVNKMPRNMKYIHEFVNEIDQLSLTKKRNITIPLIRNILEQLPD